MKLDVELQPPFKYNEEILNYFIILLVLLTIGIILFILIKKYKSKLIKFYKMLSKKVKKEY